MRPLTNGVQAEDLPLPMSKARRMNLEVCKSAAILLTANGLPCNFFDSGDDGKPDYTKWNAMLDGSISKNHIVDGFCEWKHSHVPRHCEQNKLTIVSVPIEIVAPTAMGDASWPQVIDRFWSIIVAHFEPRRDSSCVFHIHISTATKSWPLDQLRWIAKAIVFWEPATARCAPLSRQDHVQDFCKSNIRTMVPVADCWELGPLRGFLQACNDIDQATTSDAIVEYICPDKHRAWNLRPCLTGGHGSIKFRRPPGVVTAKKAKHWIAFTMAFMEMAAQFNPSDSACQFERCQHLGNLAHPDFDSQLLASARNLNVYHLLDPRLQQSDEPRSLYMTQLRPDRLQWLQARDSEYNYILTLP